MPPPLVRKNERIPEKRVAKNRENIKKAVSVLIAGVVVFVIAWLVIGELGPAAVLGAIVGVIAFMLHEDAEDMRAYYNCRDYWARGGPERRRK